MFVKWTNGWLSHTLTRHAKSRILPLMWASFQRLSGRTAHLVVTACDWALQCLTQVRRAWWVFSHSIFCFYRKCMIMCESCSLSDLCHLITAGGGLATWTRMSQSWTTCPPLFLEPRLPSMLHIIMFIITLWEQTSSSWLIRQLRPWD